MPKDFKLRPYQEDAIHLARLRFCDARSALISIFVGAGKSIIMSTLAKDYKKVVVLQPCLELVKQNHEKLAHAGLNTTMISSAHKGDWDADYIYTTPQTLSKNLGKCAEPELLIIDEANVFYDGKYFDQIFGAWPNCKVLALTATPYYYKRRTVYKGGWIVSQSTIVSIEQTYGKAVIEIDRQAGKAMGYGADIEIKRAAVPKCYDEHVQNPRVYHALIYEHLQGLFNLLTTLKNAIIFCDSKAHAELISKQGNIPTIFGDTPKKVRTEIVEKFNAGQIPFVATVGCLVRGYDRQDLENIVILTNFNNECEAEQVIGRLNRGTCKKTCWYNSRLNLAKPVAGKTTEVKVRRI